jgi:pilus assembly protein CpaF
VVVASDFDEIASETAGVVRLNLESASGEVRRLLEVASGLSQARLAVTLTTPMLAAAAVEAMGSGMNGTIASFRASNLARGLLRLPADVAAERAEVSLEAATGWVLSGFDIGLEVARLRDGRIRVLRIAELAPGPHGRIECHDIFRFAVSRVAAGGAVEGTFSPSGHIPRVATQLQAAGIRVENTMFSRPPSN